MKVIGVLDLRSGSAVHARGGHREHFAPIRLCGGIPIAAGDALGLARIYVDHFGVDDLYVADLDAIRGDAPQVDLITGLAALGRPLWLDAGVSSPILARDVIRFGATNAVVGLETLRSFQALAEICAVTPSHSVAFSLDVRDGEPIIGADSLVLQEEPQIIAGRARDAGADTIIVIDLARVGGSAGIDFALVARIRRAVPELTLLAGGGVRGPDDLTRLADAGCDGALVASALHDGHLSPADIEAAHGLP